MHSDRPSGSRMVGAPVAAVMLAVPASYAKPSVLRVVHDTLVAGSLSVWVSADLNDPSPAPNVVAVLDGWAHLDLEQAIASLQSRLPGVPTLAIVTDRQSTVAALLRAGFDDCLKWPADSNELEARVRAQSPARSATEPCAVVVDAVGLTIRCNHVQMELTPGQFRVLSQLVKVPGCWLSSAQLKQTSGSSRKGGTAIAEHVHAIRDRLQDEAWRLRSHRTLGYLFDASPSAPVDRSASLRKKR